MRGLPSGRLLLVFKA